MVDTGAIFTLVAADVLRMAGWSDDEILDGEPIELQGFQGSQPDWLPQAGYAHTLTLRLRGVGNNRILVVPDARCVITEPLADDVLIGQLGVLSRLLFQQSAVTNRLLLKREP